MADTLKAYGQLLTANEDDRTLTYRLLPFGEVGRTNRGRVVASKGVLTLLDPAQMVANMEHDGTRPVARFVSVDETDDGIEATVRVLPTTAGNDLLVEASEGVRTGISVEIDAPVIKGGALLGGTLTGAGFVTRPAFPSAQLVAADAGELDADGVEAVREALENALSVLNDSVVSEDTPEETTEEPATEEVEGVTAADAAETGNAMSNELNAAAAPVGGLKASRAGDKPAFKNVEQVADVLANAFKSKGDAGLYAALTDIVHDDGDNDGDGLGEITASPEWLGNVWNDAPYERLYIPLIQTGTLTSYHQGGFRFVNKPVVAKYAGNKAAVPSTGLTAEKVSYSTERWANAADIDRRYVDFSDSDVVAAFISANVESYKEVTDIDTLENIISVSSLTASPSAAAGIDRGVVAIADGALALLADGLRPTAAIVGADVYRNLLLTPKDKVSEFLSESFGLEGGSTAGFRIVPSAHADALGNVFVLDGRTLRLKEFGGGVPVQVRAEHVANGGQDIAVFGYTSFQVLKDGGVRRVEL